MGRTLHEITPRSVDLRPWLARVGAVALKGIIPSNPMIFDGLVGRSFERCQFVTSSLTLNNSHGINSSDGHFDPSPGIGQM